MEIVVLDIALLVEEDSLDKSQGMKEHSSLRDINDLFFN